MTDTKKKIPLAKIGRTRGLKGQVRVEIYNPDSNLFSPGKFFRISATTGFEKLTLTECSGQWCTFEEIQDPEDARKVVNEELFLYRDEMPALKKGSFYHVDLIGCEIFDQKTNERIGILQNILYTVSNDVWVIQEGQKETMIPMLQDILHKVDLDKKCVWIYVPEVI